MKLNFRQQNALSPTSSLPIILIHGLFGNLDNLGVLARDLHKDHDVIQVDLRDHGLSPRSPEVNYPDMAQDVLELMDRLEIKSDYYWAFHGGKVAMAMTAIAPDRIEKLIAIDVAPIDYQVRRHDQIFTAINAVSAAGVTQRQEAAQLMRESIKEEGVIQFLLKSFHNGEWRFNVPALWDQYENIVGWQPIPPGHIPFCLFAVNCHLIFKTAIAMRLPVNSHKHAPMLSPEPDTGCMQKNQILSYAPFTALLMKRVTKIALAKNSAEQKRTARDGC